MITLTDARCAVCATTLTGHLVACPRCDVAYHAECWSFNDGCGIYGCQPSPPRGQKYAESYPDRRRGTLSLITFGLALFVSLDQPKYGCMCPHSGDETLIQILVTTSFFFACGGVALDRPAGRAWLALLLSALAMRMVFRF